METKFLEASPGDKSSTRIFGAYGLAGAFLLALIVLLAGIFIVDKPDVISAATASGTLFITVSGPFMVLLGHNKRQEVKQELGSKGN